MHFDAVPPATLRHAVGWALMHSLWQAALLALLYRLFVAAVPARAQRARYLGGCLALALAVAAPVATASYVATDAYRAIAEADAARAATRLATGELRHDVTVGKLRHDDAVGEPRHDGAVASATSTAIDHGTGDHGASFATRVVASIERWFPAVLTGWMIGAIVGLGWLAWQCGATRRLVREARPAPAAFVELLERLAARVGVDGAVSLRRSERLDSPALVGWRRPVVLLPDAAVVIAPERLEPVLAHELAHVRRGDYAANIAQVLAERLLFFNPCLRWLSARVRAERELCCDDLAARSCAGGALAYARGLVDLEALRGRTPALAASEGNLTRRIRRLVEPQRSTSARPAMVVALLVAALAISGTATALVRASATATVLGGLDPVLLSEGSEIVGAPALAVDHDGYRYLFAAPDTRARFLEEPRRFAVRNVLLCPISGRRVQPDAYRVVDGRIILFCCPHVPESDARLRAIGATD